MSKVYQANIGDVPILVFTSAERDARFASLGGAGMVRVQNLETGYYERFDGQNWLQEGLTRSAGPVISVRAKGARGDGVTNDLGAVQAAIDAAPSGGIIAFDPSATAYRVAGTINVNKSVTIDFFGAMIAQATSNTTLFNVTAGGVTFRADRKGLLQGPQHATQQANEIAISAVGTVGSYLDGLTLDGVRVSEWGMYGAYLSFVKNFRITGGAFTNVYYTGIGCLSCSNGDVSGNLIDTVVGTPNAYGIFFSRTATASLATDPRCSDITCRGNTVKNVTNWEGIDTHAGQRIAITGNTVYGCSNAISINCSTDGVGNNLGAPLDVSVIGNTIDSGVTDGSKSYGISFIGAAGTLGSPVEKGTGVISGNTVRGHGNQALSTSGAVYVHDTAGLVITNNTLIEPGSHGIELANDNYDFVISGNVIRDQWGTAFAFPAAIECTNDYNSGIIAGNRQATGSKSATNLRVFGIRIGSSLTNSLIALSGNSMTGATTPISIATAGAIATTVTHSSPVVIGPSGTAIKQHLSATATWDPPSIASGAQATTAVSVSGAALGDVVHPSFSLHLQGLQLSAYVASAGSVNVVLSNLTGGAIDLASGTLRVDVWQH